MSIKKFLKEHHAIFLDSMIFIYFFEGYKQKEDDLKFLFENIESGENIAITSLITLSEVLVKPYKAGALYIVDEYLRFFNEFPHLVLPNFSQSCAVQTAKLRAVYNLKTPDAIQAATALTENANGLITSDKQLHCKELNFFYL